MDSGGGAVQRALADRNAHAAGALIAQPENPFIVGHHDQPHVVERCVAEDVVDPAGVLRCDPQSACLSEDVAELLARPPDRRRVDNGQEFLEVVAQNPVEEMLVAILQRHESDVLLERIGLARQVLDDARGLLLDGVDGRGQQALEPERRTLLACERAAFVVHRFGQQMGATIAGAVEI
jgi:hypothetical protein